MSYLLDANSFIQAKNDYYPFLLCPGFWEWIIQQNRAGKVYSIDKVYDELANGNDELAKWVKGDGAKLFLPFDQKASDGMTKVSAYIASQSYDPTHVRKFLSGADPLLIAYALEYRMTVVSHEARKGGGIKIPVVCSALGVNYSRTFEMLIKEGAKFILEPKQ